VIVAVNGEIGLIELIKDILPQAVIVDNVVHGFTLFFLLKIKNKFIIYSVKGKGFRMINPYSFDLDHDGIMDKMILNAMSNILAVFIKTEAC
jgi:hypothetical protein